MIPEHIEARDIRIKFKHAVLAASLKKQIERLKVAESDSDDDMKDAQQAVAGILESPPRSDSTRPTSLRDVARDGSLFHAVVMAKMKDEKQKQEALEVEQELEKDRSSNSG